MRRVQALAGALRRPPVLDDGIENRDKDQAFPPTFHQPVAKDGQQPRGRTSNCNTSMQAKYPLKVRAIRSKGRTERFYVFIPLPLPLPLAAAIGLEVGEEFQWSLMDRNDLAVRRLAPSAAQARRVGLKKSSRK